MAQKADGMNYAPQGKPSPVVKPGEFIFAASHLEHGHIYGQCNGLLEAGAQLKWVYDPDEKKVAALCRKWKTQLVAEEGQVRLLVDGYFPAKEIRTSEASAAVAHVAQVRTVRDWMKVKQRECIQFGSLVMEGRDIGPNIFPETDYKFFLDASPEVRKTRRERDGVKEDVHARDKRDSQRAHSPLMPALGAMIIDNSHQVVQETCDIMFEEINQRRKANRLAPLKPVA